MKLVDMLADVLEYPPEEASVDNMTRMHEIEDLFHRLVQGLSEFDMGYEIAVIAGVDLILYALRRHGLPEDFLTIFEVK